MVKPFSSFAKSKSDIYKEIADLLNQIGKTKNYQVAPALPMGKVGKDKTTREFRMQLIVKTVDTSESFVTHLKAGLRGNKIFDAKYNDISPNSSKYPSYTFTYKGVIVDAVIARGANKGENFETKTVENLNMFFMGASEQSFAKLVRQMEEAYPPFANTEIVKVNQRKGSTRKTGIPLEDLNAVIGDIVLTDSTGKKWYISLKDISGATVSAWPGGGSLFNSKGDLVEDSEGAEFLRTFGVDLNKVQSGFDIRNNINPDTRKKFKTPAVDSSKIQKIFEQVWGLNYFYVRRKSGGWKVFWLDRAKLDELSQSIKVTRIDYPGITSKSTRIHCENAHQKYLIEIRNSKGAEYPNDIKFRVVP
jgi:hypothetical protein